MTFGRVLLVLALAFVILLQVPSVWTVVAIIVVIGASWWSAR